MLRVRELTKVFRAPDGESMTAVDAVNFDLEKSGALGIVGESGSGKTTTARIIAGLETATSGEVLLDGVRLSPLRSRRSDRVLRAKQVQMVFQDPYSSFDPRQSIISSIDEVLQLLGDLGRAERADRANQLLNMVGLEAEHGRSRPRQLSGGQRQRAAIARALAADARLLILDEAVSALDVSVQAQIINLLMDLRESPDVDLTLLFVSHDLAVVRQVCDRCLVMKSGSVVEHGPTEKVLDDPQAPYTRDLLSAMPRPGWQPRRRLAEASSH